MATGSSSETHSLEQAARIDEICDRFESAVRDGKSPQIEDYLGDADAALRRPLLIELLLVEWDYRRGSGDTPRLEDELQRFPDDEHIVREAHRRWRIIADVDTVVSRLSDDGVLDENTVVDTIEQLPEEDQPKTGRQLINLLRRAGQLSDRRWRQLLDGRESPPDLGDYELLDVIGNGAMGRVYRARQQKLDRIVAVKMIRSGEFAGDKEVSRFYAEAEAAAKLSHPNIVPVYDVGEQDGRHFFSMGYVDGRNLKSMLDDGPLPPKQAAEFVATIAEAVQYGHDNGVVHRDLKPSNVLIDASGQPKVLDFGLAKRIDIDSGMTNTGDVLGTPSYMSPEQARGDQRAVGPLSDVYSLGALLYALTTGRPPFQSANVMETLNQVLQSDPIPPRQLVPDVPADLETICLHCLEKEPDKRYASAVELAADLRRWLNGEPIHARPATRTERLIKWAKRKPAVASALVASIIAVSALGGVLVGAVYNTRLQESLDETASAKDATEKALGAVRVAKGETDKALAAEQEANQRARRADYYRCIALAREEWVSGNSQRCFQLLSAAPKEYRRWEWDYLWRLNHRYAPQRVFGGVARPLQLLSDGRRAVVLTGGDRARVIDLESGRELQNWKVAAGSILRISADEKVAASFVRGSQLIELWSVDTGRRLRQLKFDADIDARARLMAIVFTAESDQLIALGIRGRLKEAFLIRFDTATGKITGRHPLSALYLSSSGTAANRQLARHPDGKQVVVRLSHEGFLLVDVMTGKIARKIDTRSPDGNVPRLDWLHVRSSGEHLATVHHEIVRLWKTDDWTHVCDLKHENRVTCLCFQQTTGRLITGCADRIIRIWDIASGRLVRSLRGHVAPLLSLGLTADSRTLWSIDTYGKLHKWDMAERHQEYREVAIPFAIQRIRLSSNGKTILAGGHQTRPGRHATWSVFDRETEKNVTAVANPGDVSRSLDLSADGRLAVVGSWGAPIEVHDVPSGKLLRQMNGKFPGLVALSLTPDSRFVVAAYYATEGNPGRVAVWDVADGTLKNERKLRGNVWDVACHPGGKSFLVVHGLRPESIPRLTAFHTETGEVRFQQELKGFGHLLAFSPSGDTFAVSYTSQTIELRSFPENKRVRKLFSGQVLAVDLAFSPDGRRIAAPVPGGLAIWDVENGEQVLKLKHPTCSCLAFTPDGYLISGGRDGTIRIWDGRMVK